MPEEEGGVPFFTWEKTKEGQQVKRNSFKKREGGWLKATPGVSCGGWCDNKRKENRVGYKWDWGREVDRPFQGEGRVEDSL